MFVHERRPVRGIIFIILSVVFGLIAGLLIKKTAEDSSLITTLLYRFVFAVPPLLAFAILARGKLALKVYQKKNDANADYLWFYGNGFLGAGHS